MKLLFRSVLIICFSVSLSLKAQPNLGPIITPPAAPSLSDSICPFTPYVDTSMQFVLSGFHVGDLVPDFTLYDWYGTAYNLATELQAGQPVLLIAGSYTCPQARDGFTNILPPIVAQFGQQIKIFVIYEIEAHPNSPDPSPYSGNVWMPFSNIINSIYYPQADFYYQRRNMAHLADSLLNIQVPVLIDDPCNEWVSNYGPAPHNAYLVAPSGHVFRKYGWFNNDNYDIGADIGLLLGTTGTAALSAQGPEATVYPNPSDGAAEVCVKGTDSWDLAVYDITGKCILSEQRITRSSFSLETRITSPGIYTYTVTTAAGQLLHGRMVRR